MTKIATLSPGETLRVVTPQGWVELAVVPEGTDDDVFGRAAALQKGDHPHPDTPLVRLECEKAVYYLAAGDLV